MEYRQLGRTGLTVSVIGLGAGSFGKFGENTEADCVRIAHRAFDAGINLIDTADIYSFGESETITGTIISDRRHKLVLTTKCGSQMAEGYFNKGGSRRWIHLAVEDSLRRLKTDYIDVFQLHRPDFTTDIQETVHAFNELIRAGKIRYFGTSNFSAEMITEATLRGQMDGLVGPHTEQGPYSIFNRFVEGNVLPTCRKFRIGFMCYSPLDNGFLTGRYRHGKEKEASPRHNLFPGNAFDFAQQHRKLDAVEELIKLAQEIGTEISHLALAFAWAHPDVATVLVGPRKMSYMDNYLAGKDLWLSPEVMDKIDAIVAPGTSLNPPVLVPPPSLTDKKLRRRISREG